MGATYVHGTKVKNGLSLFIAVLLTGGLLFTQGGCASSAAAQPFGSLCRTLLPGGRSALAGARRIRPPCGGPAARTLPAHFALLLPR